MWPDIFSKVSSSEEILKFLEKNMQKGLEEYLQSSPFSKHQWAEEWEQPDVYVTVSAPGLLINGFKVFSLLKHLLRSYKIQLSNCKSDQTQVEHDIIHIAPDGDRVRVNFTEAKASMEIPWPHEADKPRNIVSACETAFQRSS